MDVVFLPVASSTVTLAGYRFRRGFGGPSNPLGARQVVAIVAQTDKVA
jgi:hypothetical protein